MRFVTLMPEVHHIFKSTLTKLNTTNSSLKGAVLFMKKSHEQIASCSRGGTRFLSWTPSFNTLKNSALKHISELI